MKLGFGLYRHMLDDDNLSFARQVGATHLVVHLVDYFKDNDRFSSSDQPVGDEAGWGYASGEMWDVEMLREIKARIESHGLVWHAVENLDPRFWDHVLFNGPKKTEQIEIVRQIIRNLGRAGIPVLGYNFSLAGVTGRIQFDDARGGARTVGMSGSNRVLETPLPNSMAWNMVVDEKAQGIREPMSEAQLWENFAWFLKEVLPTAEESHVVLALHPDDPPLDTVRGLPKLVNQPDKYQKVIDVDPSRSNGLELCLGTLSEMTTGDIYEATRNYVSQGRVPYLHLRNVIGKVPFYKEVFIDEGQIDVGRIIALLGECGYDGVIIPDHSPQVTCPAPWHAGMAYAMGYIKALIKNACSA